MDATISRNHPIGPDSSWTNDMFRIPYQIILILRPIDSIVFTINSASKREKYFGKLGSMPKGFTSL